MLCRLLLRSGRCGQRGGWSHLPLWHFQQDPPVAWKCSPLHMAYYFTWRFLHQVLSSSRGSSTQEQATRTHGEAAKHCGKRKLQTMVRQTPYQGSVVLRSQVVIVPHYTEFCALFFLSLIVVVHTSYHVKCSYLLNLFVVNCCLDFLDKLAFLALS